MKAKCRHGRSTQKKWKMTSRRENGLIAPQQQQSEDSSAEVIVGHFFTPLKSSHKTLHALIRVSVTGFNCELIRSRFPTARLGTSVHQVPTDCGAKFPHGRHTLTLITRRALGRLGAIVLVPKKDNVFLNPRCGDRLIEQGFRLAGATKIQNGPSDDERAIFQPLQMHSNHQRARFCTASPIELRFRHCIQQRISS